MTDTHEQHACGTCALPPTRREFIRNLTLTVAGALASVGVAERLAAQIPRDITESIGGGPQQRQYAVPSGNGVQIDRANEVILVRWDNSVYAFNLSCPHQNTALRWNEKDSKFKCPKHNSRYLPDGTFIDGRATRGLDRFSIALAGTNIVVDTNAMHKQDADPQGWTAAVVKVA